MSFKKLIELEEFLEDRIESLDSTIGRGYNFEMYKQILSRLRRQEKTIHKQRSTIASIKYRISIAERKKLKTDNE